MNTELDAYYAHLYCRFRDELRCILDPKEVYGEDFPRNIPRAEGEGSQAVWGVSDETSRSGGVGCARSRMNAEG